MIPAGLAALRSGTRFADDFRILQPLGEGGMGAVYVVEQLSTGRRRALKLMLPQLVADPKLRARFEQEARIGSRIESEHVVEVVGAGVDGTTGIPWLAMELLQGESLASLIRRAAPLPGQTTLGIVEQLCHALGAAHAANIVHRDLKPENIFVARARRAGVPYTVKILDFGIAKIVAEAKTTQTAAIGSPMWMAPEQTERGGAIGPHTDVWSMGLIVFHLLTGKFFWRSAGDEGATAAHLLREILMDPMPLASQRARELGAATALPPGFDPWFSRSTDRVVRDRFPEAHSQLQALKALYASVAPALASTDVAPDQVRTIEQPPLDLAVPPSPTLSELEPTLDVTPREGPAPQGTIVSTAPAVSTVSVAGPAASLSGSAKRRWIRVGAFAAIAGGGVGALAFARKVPERSAPPAVSAAVPNPSPIVPATTGGTDAPENERSPLNEASTSENSSNLADALAAATTRPAPSATGEPTASVPPVMSPVWTSAPAPVRRVAPSPVANPPNGDARPSASASAATLQPASFDVAEAKVRLAAAAATAQDCKKVGGPTGTGRVLIVFAPDGTAQVSVVEGAPFEGTPTGACVAGRFRSVRVPPFSGDAFPVRKTFTIE